MGRSSSAAWLGLARPVRPPPAAGAAAPLLQQVVEMRLHRLVLAAAGQRGDRAHRGHRDDPQSSDGRPHDVSTVQQVGARAGGRRLARSQMSTRQICRRPRARSAAAMTTARCGPSRRLPGLLYRVRGLQRGTPMSHLKIECARRQLGTALDLYLRDRDPVSVHCLANGGCELIEVYAKKAGAKPFVSHILETRPDLDIKALKTVQRKYWNAFKHALERHGGDERDDDELLSSFTDEQNDVALFIGWYDYAQATKMMPVEAQVHQIWWIALHPDKLDPKHASKLTRISNKFFHWATRAVTCKAKADAEEGHRASANEQKADA